VAIATRLAARLEAAGAAEVIVDEAAPGRPNVYAVVPGQTDRVVVLDVHTDTVTVEHMTDPPFDGRIEDGGVWGRGALDTKASLGVILALLESWNVADLRPEPTLLVLGSASEEAGGLLGAVRFRGWVAERQLEIDQLIVAEPTKLTPVRGHKGGVLLTITAHGQSCHSALPELGANAVEAMAPVIAAFVAEHERLQRVAPTTELGTGTLTVTAIEGGSGGNVVPDRCTLTVGRRSVPGEDSTLLYDEIVAMARAACPLPIEAVPLIPPTPEGQIGSNAFFQSADTRLVALLADATGNAATVAPFGSNALRYEGLATEMVVFGPGSIDDAHQATECVAITDLVRLAEVYERWLRPA
jgi:acetylornithine deacetylase/succinyl-diaminopimelate desuccinylase-like protein